MYSVYGDGVCIYSDRFLWKNTKALNPKLTLSDNAAGSLEITLPVGNAGYDILERLSSEIVVFRDSEEIWAGRIINEKENFWNHRILTCEGELAYLNDTTQPPSENFDMSVYDFLYMLIANHNSKVGSDKQFAIGAVTVTEDNTTRYTNYETTLSCISEKLVKRLGGHIRVRKVDGVRYLDYLADYPNTNTQIIRFGENLLDFTKNWDMTKLATVILPRGARLNSSPIEALEAYLTVESVNAGSIYVTSEDAISTYGWIEQVVDWEDVTDASDLLLKAQTYLTDAQFVDMILELSALDLHVLSPEIEAVKLLDNVRCISNPHGMDRYFPVSELTIPLDKPENATYTLGTTVQTTLTGSNKVANEKILEKIENLPTKQSILDSARDQASSLINMATNGFVTITRDANGSQELYIANSQNLASATKHWRWNLNGLGFWNGQYDSYGNKVYLASITRDGAIVADIITTGTMSADRVRTGILQSAGSNPNVIFDLTNGTLTIKKGSITLGISASYPNGRFSVDDYGELKATYGEIGGFRIDAYSIYNDVIDLNSNGLNFSNGTDLLGSYGTNQWALQPTRKGMTVGMENTTSYISWSYRETASASTYTMKLMYASRSLLKDGGKSFTSDRVHLGCDLDGNDWGAYHFWIDPDTGGVDGGMTLNDGDAVRIGLVNSSGSVTGYFWARIVNGFILPD